MNDYYSNDIAGAAHYARENSLDNLCDRAQDADMEPTITEAEAIIEAWTEENDQSEGGSDCPSVGVEKGIIGVWIPRLCPHTDAIIGGHFEPAPAIVQVAYDVLEASRARVAAVATAAYSDEEPF